MRLKKVRVQMFRNILDSSEVNIQPDVTCLVGKNESGKTAFLQALWRLRPARINSKFSIHDHYPAWLEKKHRNEGRNLEDLCPVQAVYSWQKADIELIDAKFGPGVAPKSGDLTISKRYSNSFSWTHGCNENQAVQNLLAKISLSASAQKIVKDAKSVDGLRKIINLKLNSTSNAMRANMELINARLAKVFENLDFSIAVWNVLESRIPKFFYFAEYSKLPYTVKIDTVLTGENEKLSESEATARSLLRLGGAEAEYLLNPDYERRKRELENVANSLTSDVLQYWSQNPDLRVQPEITQRTENRPNGQHTVLDELKIRIWDNRHSLSLPFNEHSAGFQWFFSFLAAFSEFENQDPPVIILLDEPGIGLHARAQADFLRFIEERLTNRCQVIYTTHSPFMVQPGHLERVRTVEDRSRDEGSKVSDDVLSRDPDTLFPLQGALGYDLVQHLFIAEHNLVVEGTSDYTYIRSLSDHLKSIGRVHLDAQWSIVPVGGADAIPTFVALLGMHLNVTVVLDSRKEGNQKLTRLATGGRLKKNRILMIGDLLQRKIADIEDLFAEQEYLSLYNRAFGDTISESDLVGADSIVSRIARYKRIERFDHGVPADLFLRERDSILPTLSEQTLSNYEALFERINATLGS